VTLHLFDELDIEISKRTLRILREINEKSKYKILKEFKTVTGTKNEFLSKKLRKLLTKKFVEYEIKNLKEIKKEFPFLREDKSYIVSEDSLYVDPGELLYSIYSYLRTKNHEFRFFHELKNLEISNGKVEAIETSRGKFYFDKYIIATGIWTKKILKKIGIKIVVKPYRTQAAIVGLQKELDIPIYNDLDYNIYMRKELSQDILVGDGTETKESDIYDFRISNDENFIFNISEKINKIIEEAGDFEYKGGWAFLCLATPDKKPIVSRVKEIENLYIFCGFNGLGIMRAPALSEILAECVMDDFPLPKEFSLERFKNVEDFDIKEGFYPE